VTLAAYDRLGVGYSDHRRPDPRIRAQIHAALGDARSVVNVGAGTGSYEPAGRRVAAVEPSAVMVGQRPAGGAPAVRAGAGELPFRTGSFDAALAILTLHHWPDWRAGLAEMLRVARGRVVVLTWDPESPGFWLVQDYVPEVLAIDARIFPTMAAMEEVLGPLDVRPVPIAADCTDGFLGAYWRRPEAYLDAGVRGAISTFARVPALAEGISRLDADLASGAWAERHGHLLELDELDIGYRLVIAG
jgi:SAM-dependent methyltransferase